MVGISVLIWAVLFSTFKGNDPYATKYHYDGVGGQRDWEDVCKTGTEQSPINIENVNVVVERGKLNFYDYREVTVLTLTNNKNSLTITVKAGGSASANATDVTSATPVTEPANAIEKRAAQTDQADEVFEADKTDLDPTVKFYGIDYKLETIYFHWGNKKGEQSTGSEHSINGNKKDMEVQLLHRGKEDDSMLLVVAFHLSVGGSGRDLLVPIEETLAEDDVINGVQAVDITGVALNEFVPINEIQIDFYWYNGSLTVPPCTEGVIWCVAHQVFNVSEAQIEKFNNLSCHEKDEGNKGHIRNLQTQHPLNVTRVRERRLPSSKGISVRESRQIRPTFYITSMVILFVAI